MTSLALLALALPGAPAAAEDWKPTRAVELVVAAGPGGSLDQVARTLGGIMEKQGTVSRWWSATGLRVQVEWP